MITNPPTPDKRRLLLIVLLVPLALTSYLSGAAFRFGSPGFRVDKTQHGLLISRILQDENPVRTGDQIVAINGLHYNQVLGCLLTATAGQRPAVPSLVIDRGGEHHLLRPKVRPLTPTLFLAIGWPHLLLITLFLILGTIALLRAGPQQPAGIFFLMLCGFSCTIASTLPSHFGLLDPATISLSFIAITLSNWLAFGGLAHFTCRFPIQRDLCQGRPLLALAFYTGPALLALACTLATDPVHFFSTLQRFRNVGIPFIIIGCFIKHLSDQYLLRSPLARNQVKLILTAYGLTFAPYLFLYLLPILFFDTPLISFRIILFAATILPSAYLIGLLRYRLLGVDRMISRSLAYLSVIVVLTLAYGGLLALLKNQLFGRGVLTEQLFLLFIILVALLLNPLVNLVQRLLDHWLFHRRDDDQTILLEFSHRLATTLEFPALVDLIIGELPEKLQVETVALLILEEKHSRLYPEHLRIGSAPWGRSRLVDHFRGGAEVVLCQEQKQDPDLDREIGQLREAGFRLVLPLHQGRELAGLLLVGALKNGRMFIEQDIHLLATLANQVSVALLNARNYTSLLESRDQLETLFTRILQSEKMAALGEMSATLAHEIRNPLGIIRSSAQYLAEESRSDEINQEMLHYIMDEVDGLNQVVGNILGLARFKNPRFEPVDLEEEIPAICHRWLNSGDHNPAVTITWRISGRLPLVSLDPGQIGQVMFNLLRNSEEAMTGDGTIEVIVEGEGDEVVIRLLDNGPGIEDIHKDALFDNFFTTKTNGLGLGLSLCRQIVDAHHGTIEIGNRDRGGVEVVIKLPCHPLDNPPDNRKDQDHASENSDSRG